MLGLMNSDEQTAGERRRWVTSDGTNRAPQTGAHTLLDSMNNVGSSKGGQSCQLPHLQPEVALFQGSLLPWHEGHVCLAPQPAGHPEDGLSTRWQILITSGLESLKLSSVSEVCYILMKLLMFSNWRFCDNMERIKFLLWNSASVLTSTIKKDITLITLL